jgi:hypothetical protein
MPEKVINGGRKWKREPECGERKVGVLKKETEAPNVNPRRARTPTPTLAQPIRAS